MALKPLRLTTNLPGELEALIKVRVEEERYPSASAYITGLVLFDIYARRPHWLTASLMREPVYVRDAVILELVRDFDDLEKKKPGWMERRIKELIAEAVSKGKPAL